MATLLELLAARLASLRASELSPPTVARVKDCIYDVIVRTFENRGQKSSRVAREVTASWAGPGAATVWADGRRASVLDAAYANAAGAGSMDIHAASCSHPGCVVVPAAFAVGESVGASGSAVVEAVVRGYEATTQIGLLGATRSFIEKGFRPTGLFGPFGAAAAATSLLDGDEAQVVDALALAASHGGGVCQWAEAGTRDGPFQNANAARGGVQAALLAAHGVHAPADTLEGRFGFLQAYAGLVPDGGRPWPQDDRDALADIEFKSAPSCAYTQETLEAGLRLHRRGVAPDTVTSIEVSGYRLVKAYPGCDYAGPFLTPEHGLFSNQAVLAAAILGGDDWRARIAQPDDDAFAALVNTIDIAVDPDAEAHFPDTRRVTVTVRLTDGAALHEHVATRPLERPNHAPTRAAARLAEHVGDVRAARIAEAVDRLDELPTIRDLVEPLRGLEAGAAA